MTSQRERAETYLESNYYPEMRGPVLAEQLNIPARSARRYLRTYRQRMKKAFEYNPTLNVQPQTLTGVVFDIETTDFGTEGYSGYLICCSFADMQTGNVKTLEITYNDLRDDRRLIREVAKELSKYILHVGHNIAAYDYNWLNSRLSYHRMPTLDSSLYIDTYQLAKSLGIKTRKSLGNLIDYYGLEGVKTTIYKTSWSKVMSPEEPEFDDALDEIVEHCEYDVLANRELLHQVILPYSQQMGRINPIKVSKIGGNYWKYQD